MLLLITLTQLAAAGEIAISPLTATDWGSGSCPWPLGATILFYGNDYCQWGYTSHIPLSPMMTNRTVDTITICYATEMQPLSTALGFQFSIVETVDAASDDVVLWSDGLWRLADPGVCEVIPVAVRAAGTPVLKIEASISDDDSMYIGQIWMSVSK